MLVAVTVLGCRSERGFVEVAEPAVGSIRFRLTAPVTHGPGLGPAHQVFRDAGHGYAATSGGAWWVPHTGFQPPVEPAEIDETRDGGRTWRVLWRGRRAFFDGIGFSSRYGYAYGEQLLEPRSGGPLPSTRPFVLATHDAGRTWMMRSAPFAARTGDVHVAAFGRVVVVAVGGRAARSDDAGRTWRRVRTPRLATTVRFATPLRAFAGARCIWRTLDGGVSWRRLGATCGPPVTDLEAVGRRVAAGQSWSWSTDRTRNVVRVSTDGGSTWRIAADEDGPRWAPLVRVHFADLGSGWAVSWEDAQHVIREAVHVTADGGRSWRERPFPELPTAFAGATRAWAGTRGGSGVWRTSDRGRTWRVSVRPRDVRVYAIVAATRRRLLVETAIGTLRSDDAGRTWRSVAAPSRRGAAVAAGSPAYVAEPAPLEGVAVVRVRRGWRPLHPPTRGVGSVAFTDPLHGAVASGQADDYGRVPVAVTHDGGRTWARVHVPKGVHFDDYAVVGRDVTALLRDRFAFVSLDEGAHWTRIRVPDAVSECTTARFGAAVWVACSGAGTARPSLLLRSEDAGKTWIERRSMRGVQVVPVSAREAWGVTGWNDEVAHPVWHTTDGGATWISVWPRIRPDTVFAVRSPR